MRAYQLMLIRRLITGRPSFGLRQFRALSSRVRTPPTFLGPRRPPFHLAVISAIPRCVQVNREPRRTIINGVAVPDVPRKYSDDDWIILEVERSLDQCRNMEKKKQLNKDLDVTSLSWINFAHPASAIPWIDTFFDFGQLRRDLQRTMKLCDRMEDRPRALEMSGKLGEYLRRVDEYLVLIRGTDKFNFQWVRYQRLKDNDLKTTSNQQIANDLEKMRLSSDRKSRLLYAGAAGAAACVIASS